jgi:histidinol-phosphatase (PHP family)
MDLTGDGHVHTEWSYDTGGPHSDAAGRMRLMCRRAVLVGLPALAFTEHLDFTGWAITPEDELPDYCRPWVDEDGVLTPPLLDVEGYLERSSAVDASSLSCTFSAGSSSGSRISTRAAHVSSST